MNAISGNERSVSEKEQGGQGRDFVLDFLYHDARRVGSFLAQFDDAGHLQSVTQSESVAKGYKRGWRFALGGGISDLGSAEASAERGPAEVGSEASERVYDPLWTNARALLDYLAEREMIQRNIWDARIGQFVLSTGNLVVLDLSMVKSAWEKPAVNRLMQQEHGEGINRQQRRRNEARKSPEQNQIHLVLELLSMLPHSIQAQLIGDGFRIWASLDARSLVGMSSDLVLKHGSFVPGTWSILGVLDAVPEETPPPEAMAQLSALEQRIAAVAGTLIGKVAAQLCPITRRLLGRPHGAHGVTPLLIFREVSGSGEERPQQPAPIVE